VAITLKVLVNRCFIAWHIGRVIVGVRGDFGTCNVAEKSQDYLLNTGMINLAQFSIYRQWHHISHGEI